MMFSKVFVSAFLSFVLLGGVSIACSPLTHLLDPYRYPGYIKEQTWGLLQVMYHENDIFSIVSWADVTSFAGQRLYGMDINAVYYAGKPIVWADTDSFEVLNDIYSKDKNSVYFKLVSIPADWNSFELLKGDYARDKDLIYFQDQNISASPDKFISNGRYGADKATSMLYDNGELLWYYKQLSVFERWIGSQQQQLFVTAKNIFGPEWKLWRLFWDNLVGYNGSVLDDDFDLWKKIGWLAVGWLELDEYIELEYSISWYEDTYFFYVSLNDTQCWTNNNLVLPKSSFVSIFDRRSARLSSTQRSEYVSKIQNRLTASNLTLQDRAILLTAQYVLQK